MVNSSENIVMVEIISTLLAYRIIMQLNTKHYSSHVLSNQ